MWKIEKCYKIIFEAILEQEALKKICTEVGMYTNAGIAFINVAGNLEQVHLSGEIVFQIPQKKSISH